MIKMKMTELKNEMTKPKLSCLRHVMRKMSLEKAIILEKIEGSRTREEDQI